MTDKTCGLEASHYNAIVGFIWSIADDCLRDVYVRGKYRDVILPMTVIRRLDAILEDTKDKVLSLKKKLDAAGYVGVVHRALTEAQTSLRLRIDSATLAERMKSVVEGMSIKGE